MGCQVQSVQGKQKQANKGGGKGGKQKKKKEKKERDHVSSSKIRHTTHLRTSPSQVSGNCCLFSLCCLALLAATWTRTALRTRGSLAATLSGPGKRHFLFRSLAAFNRPWQFWLPTAVALTDSIFLLRLLCLILQSSCTSSPLFPVLHDLVCPFFSPPDDCRCPPDFSLNLPMLLRIATHIDC